jgi:hypothetical protein
LVVLSGGLSNHDLQGLLNSLTGEESHQVRRRAQPRVGWPDGRRQFGEVSGAIKAVLAADDVEMRVKDVHAEVERLLGGEVSFQSVADFLTENSKGAKPLFERPRYGHYRLVRFEPG